MAEFSALMWGSPGMEMSILALQANVVVLAVNAVVSALRGAIDAHQPAYHGVKGSAFLIAISVYGDDRQRGLIGLHSGGSFNGRILSVHGGLIGLHPAAVRVNRQGPGRGCCRRQSSWCL